jgi:hypothetical protein
MGHKGIIAISSVTRTRFDGLPSGPQYDRRRRLLRPSAGSVPGPEPAETPESPKLRGRLPWQAASPAVILASDIELQRLPKEPLAKLATGNNCHSERSEESRISIGLRSFTPFRMTEKRVLQEAQKFSPIATSFKSPLTPLEKRGEL